MDKASKIFEKIRGLFSEQGPGHISSEHGPGKKKKRGTEMKNYHSTRAIKEEFITQESIDEMVGANMNTRDVHKHLKKNGWGLTRTKGDHDVYTHPKSVNHISVPRHKSLSTPLVIDILKKSKIDESEQIDEISKETSRSYLVKTGKQIDKGIEDKAKREKRIDGYFAASKRLSGEKPTSEAVEQIDEISKGTLASYIGKAAKSSAEAANVSGFKAGKANPKYNTSSETSTEQKRNKGIALAAKKLSREGMELAIEETLTESRKAEIVKETFKKAKEKKKETKDKFESDPELSSQIIRND